MKRTAVVLLLVLLSLNIFPGISDAGQRGQANLFIRAARSNDTDVTVKVGDIIQVQAWIEGNGEAITQASLILSIDDQYLEVIPVNQQGNTLRPFNSGGFLSGQVNINDTGGDVIGNAMKNQVPLFQMQYSELIAKFQGAPQRFASGNGLLATAQLRVIRKPGNGATRVRVDVTIPSGQETGYFINGEGGVIYNFRSVEHLEVNIEGIKLSSQIPDLIVQPGQINTSLDLDDYLNEEANPDSTITWTSSVASPDSIQVSVDGTSHVVTVDPRFDSLGGMTNFIGIATVAFTASTDANESASGTIRVIVDTPPDFTESAMPDTIQFAEDDSDDTIILTATDPDERAILSYSVLEPDSTVNTTVSIDPSTRRVTFGARLDYSGTEVRRFEVRDQFGLADTTEIRVVVTPVNDPPEYIKTFPEDITIGMLEEFTLALPEFVNDVDDQFEDLHFTLTGVDSVAFEVSPENAQLTITAVPPFMGIRSAVVVVADPSNGTATQEIIFVVVADPSNGTATPVNPTEDAQPPVVLVDVLKMDVTAGSNPTEQSLDELVNDLDTADNQLTWAVRPVGLVQVEPVALSNRRFQLSAPSESVGFVSTALIVTDPTALFDTLSVRIYSSSLTDGVPAIGGMPDLFMIAGSTDTLALDDYYFDADDSDLEVTWAQEGAQDVTVDIGSSPPHRAIFRAPGTTFNAFEEVIFTVSDDQGNSASDTVRVTVLEAGSIVIDMNLVGSQVTLARNESITIDLNQALVAGEPNNIVWTALSNNKNADVPPGALDNAELILFGAARGRSLVTVTATDSETNFSVQGYIDVTITPAATGGSLELIKTFPLVIKANRDTTIDLTTLVVRGSVPRLLWFTGGNEYVGVEVDQADQTAILRSFAGFVGNAGSITFRAEDSDTGDQAFSVASPVTVASSASAANSSGSSSSPTGSSELTGELPNSVSPFTRGLLKVSVVANPVLPNFLDVFVISQKSLLGEPVLGVTIGIGTETKPVAIPLEPVEEALNVWVGDLSISDAIVGRVQISATGITENTRVALTDTLNLEIEAAGVQATFSISNPDVAVDLPKQALSKSALVALIPDGATTELNSVGTFLRAASRAYTVHSTGAEVNRSGEIRFSNPGSRAEKTGVYRWNGRDQEWDFMGSKLTNGGISGTFTSFGRYALFVDDHSPQLGNPKAIEGVLSIPVAEIGTGIDVRSLRLVVDGSAVRTSYDHAGKRVVWRPEQVFEPGNREVRLELSDLAGNSTIWERQLDLGKMFPRPSRFVLHQNFPNPFNPETVIRFEVPKAAQVRLAIYNLLGQRVRQLVGESLAAGRYTLSWDGLDDSGCQAATGMYLYRLESPNVVLTKKMLLLK